MIERHIDIAFDEFYSIEELSFEDRELIENAIEARKTAYTPYSHFNVGAALRLSNGLIVRGSNQENAAFPSGICAERSAMFAAGSQFGDTCSMQSIAIVGGIDDTISDDIVTPCGACRQVMAEYQKRQGEDMSIILVGKNRICKFSRVQDLLPLVFNSI